MLPPKDIDMDRPFLFEMDCIFTLKEVQGPAPKGFLSVKDVSPLLRAMMHIFGQSTAIILFFFKIDFPVFYGILFRRIYEFNPVETQ